MTIEPQRRNTVRGRPKVTDGSMECARCHREMRRTAATWPDGRICNSCYYEATSLYGDCPSCGFHRLLPGRLDIGDQAVCRDCARIRQNFYCTSCNEERRPYRGKVCARCSLREDLERTFGHANSPAGFCQLIDALCAADRAESIITWKRSDKVQELLRSLGDGTTPLTHAGLDQFVLAGRHVDHLRAGKSSDRWRPDRAKSVSDEGRTVKWNWPLRGWSARAEQSIGIWSSVCHLGEQFDLPAARHDDLLVTEARLGAPAGLCGSCWIWNRQLDCDSNLSRCFNRISGYQAASANCTETGHHPAARPDLRTRRHGEP